MQRDAGNKSKKPMTEDKSKDMCPEGIAKGDCVNCDIVECGGYEKPTEDKGQEGEWAIPNYKCIAIRNQGFACIDVKNTSGMCLNDQCPIKVQPKGEKAAVPAGSKFNNTIRKIIALEYLDKSLMTFVSNVIILHETEMQSISPNNALLETLEDTLRLAYELNCKTLEKMNALKEVVSPTTQPTQSSDKTQQPAIVEMIEVQKDWNPYPDDVFTPKTDEQWREFHVALNAAGLVGDGYLGCVAREAYNLALDRLVEILREQGGK